MRLLDEPITDVDQHPEDRHFDRAILVRVFWIALAVLVVYVLASLKEVNGNSLVLGGLLGVFTLLPAYLWCAGKLPGIPIFPLHALPFLWGFVFPLLTSPPSIAQYGIEARLEAAIAVAAYLAVATLACSAVLQIPARPPTVYFVLPFEAGDRLLLSFLAFGCFAQANIAGRWMAIPFGLHSVVNAANYTLATLAVAALAYRWGKGALTPNTKIVFVLLMFLYLTLQITGLLLVSALSLVLFAATMYTMGSHRLPVVLITTAMVIFSILHLGKMEMRNKYWQANIVLQPWDYPGFFGEWFGYGLEATLNPMQAFDDRASDQATLMQRASLIQMTMLVQTKTPDPLPFLYGETYAIIPPLLVPRMINPDKAWTHEGTYILCTYYGLQTREDTRNTTIGFGMLSESYANFGYPGVMGLAIIMGVCFGLATRLALHVPLLSLRGLFAIIVLSNAIQLEAPASVFVTAVFQSTVILAGVAIVLMYRVEPELHSASPSAEVSTP